MHSWEKENGKGKWRLSVIKKIVLLGNQKEWNLAICNKVGGTRVYYAKGSKSEQDKYPMISLICGI